MPSRDVILNLILKADQANAKTAEAAAKQVETAQEKAQKAHEKTATHAKKQEDEVASYLRRVRENSLKYEIKLQEDAWKERERNTEREKKSAEKLSQWKMKVRENSRKYENQLEQAAAKAREQAAEQEEKRLEQTAQWKVKVKENSRKYEYKLEEEAQRAQERAAEKEKRSAEKLAQWKVKVRENSRRYEDRLNAQIQAAHEKSQRDIAAGNAAMVGGFKQSAEGVTQLARSLVLLGISSEEDLEKALKTLAKFEAGVNLLKGTINIVQGVSRAYRGLQGATAAATAVSVAGSGAVTAALTVEAGAATRAAMAHALLNRARGFAGGLARVGRVAGPLAGATVAGIGAGAALAAGGSPRRTLDNLGALRWAGLSALNPFDPGGSKRDAEIAASNERFAGFEERSNSFRERAMAANAAHDSARRNIAQSRAEQEAAFGAGRGKSGIERDLSVNSAVRRVVEESLREAQRRTMFSDSGAGKMEGAQDQVTALEKIKRLREEEMTLQEQQHRQAIDIAKQELSLQQQALQTLQDRIAAEKAKLLTAEERLANLDPVSIRRLRDIQGKAEAGGELSFSEAKLAREHGLRDLDGTVDAKAQEAIRRQLSQLGGDPLVKGTRDFLADAAKEEEERKKRIAGLEKDISEEEEAIDGIKQKFAEIVQRIYRRIEGAMEEVASKEREAAIQSAQRERDKSANTSAAGGV